MLAFEPNDSIASFSKFTEILHLKHGFHLNNAYHRAIFNRHKLFKTDTQPIEKRMIRLKFEAYFKEFRRNRSKQTSNVLCRLYKPFSEIQRQTTDCLSDLMLADISIRDLIRTDSYPLKCFFILMACVTTHKNTVPTKNTQSNRTFR